MSGEQQLLNHPCAPLGQVCSVPSTAQVDRKRYQRTFSASLLGFLEERIVDAVDQNQPGQLVLYTGDPVIIRRTLFFDSFAKP